MPWKKILAYATGEVDETNLKIIDYLLEENRVLKRQVDKSGRRILLTDGERRSLANKAVSMGKHCMDNYVTIVQPATVLKWFRTLVAHKFDGTKNRKTHGRPPVSSEIEELVITMAGDNPTWGCDKIMGALVNIGYTISDTTVGRILEKHGIAPSPERTRRGTWKQFIKQQKHVLFATDFFTTEIWTGLGLTTYYVLFFIKLETREVIIAGATRNPNAAWVEQCARNLTGWESDFHQMRYIIHDRDSKYTGAFDMIFRSVGIRPIKLPIRSPNLNAYAERFVRSIKYECLNRLVLFGEKSLRYVLKEYVEHYHNERNHQGIGNRIPCPGPELSNTGKIVKRERLGGLLNYYYREAA